MPEQTTPSNQTTSTKPKLKICCHACNQKLDVTALPPFSTIVCPACGTRITVPKWFATYLLLELGGVGGMAKIYRAMDFALDREVAVKVMNPEVLSSESINIFLNEARNAATLIHPAVIPVYTSGMFENQPYIVMQYMYGGSLEELLRKIGKLPAKKVMRWMRDTAAGLRCAKNAGIVHHDVKPANIMLDDDGKAKIGDFGISQSVNEKGEGKDEYASWLSPIYVSPEKVKSGTEDWKGDVYSLGVTFYQLLTGEAPFKDDDNKKLLEMRLKKKPVPPIELNEEIPSVISDLIMTMLEIDPEARPDYKEIMTVIDDELDADLLLIQPAQPIEPGTEPSASEQHKVKKGGFIRKKPHAQSQGGGNPPVKRKFIIKQHVKPEMTMKEKLIKLAWKTGTILAIVIACMIIFPIIKSYYKAHQTEVDKKLGKYGIDIKKIMRKDDPETNRNPLSMDGDLALLIFNGKAVEASEKADELYEKFSDSTEQRIRNCLVGVFMKFLADDKTAVDSAKLAYKKLKILEADPDADSAPTMELITKDTPAQKILAYLSGTDTDPVPMLASMKGTTDDMYAAAVLSSMLKYLSLGKKGMGNMKTAMVKYEEAVKMLPDDIWITIWKHRTDIWRDAVDGKFDQGILVEPAFMMQSQKTKKK